MNDAIRTDLHGHSHLSDGNISPEAYVRARAERGLEVIALSDHDILTGVFQVSGLARELGLTLVPAMEATAFIHFGTEQAEQVHVLAYFPPSKLDRLKQTRLYARSQRVLARWREFALAWLEGLSPEDRRRVDARGELPALAPERFPGLQSFLKRLIDGKGNGAVARPPPGEDPEPRKALYTAFQKHHVRFWTEDRALFGWTPEELIETIRADGALDVVAHPNRVRDHERMARVLEAASGVEVYTSRHSAPIAQRFLDFAASRKKHWTASTDDHQHPHLGRYHPPPSGTPRRTVERILAGS